MAETAGLVVGAVALAGLFNTCLECFDTVQLAQNHGRDYEIAQMKLQLGRSRLVLWGRTVWVPSQNYDGGQPRANGTRLKLHPRWQAEWNNISDRVETALKALTYLFKDVENLERKYGLKRNAPATTPAVSGALLQTRSSTTTYSDALTDTAMNRNTVGTHNPVLQPYVGVSQPVNIRFPDHRNMLEDSMGNRQRSLGLGRKVAWAIRDRAKLNDLIAEISGFLDELEHISSLVGTLDEQRQMMNEAVSGVTTPANMQLLEDAAQDLPRPSGPAHEATESQTREQQAPIALGNEYIRAVVHDRSVMINGPVGANPEVALPARTRHVDPQAFDDTLMINGPVTGDVLSRLIYQMRSDNAK